MEIMLKNNDQLNSFGTTRIKKTIVCKDIKQYMVNDSICKTYLPQAGDVAFFEVIKTGRHKTIQSETKRNVLILPGDIIMATFANRYATEQFEGYIPEKPTEIVDILAAGGAVGIVKTKNAALEDIEPTKIRLVGYATDTSGNVLNTIHYKVKKVKFTGIVPNGAKVILSVGATMDSGKTTSAAFLVRGLKSKNKKVVFIKLTGTSYTKDQDLAYDCGADATLDFSDAGFPSTYMCSKEEILDLYQTLLNKIAIENPDYIVMEVADGLMQRETEFLLKDHQFMSTINSVIFSCADSLAAFYGIHLLNINGIRPSLISGKFTMSPLLIEEVKARCEIPVATIEELMLGNYNYLFEEMIPVHAHAH
jgi:hypothetical protein